MSWFGKIVGGGVGFLFGGPLGAVGGAALGHLIFDGEEKSLSNNEQVQATYFISLFSMLAKIAKADGVVSKEEIDTVARFMQQMNLDSQQQQFAINIFNEAKNSPHTISDFATDFYNIVKNTKDSAQVLNTIFSMLFEVSASDGVLDANEERMLKEVARIFRIDSYTFNTLKNQFFSSNNFEKSETPDNLDKAYLVLKLSKNASVSEIKKQYREMVSQFHPDKIVSKGLPEEFTKFAEKKFKEIQDAYDLIRKAKSF